MHDLFEKIKKKMGELDGLVSPLIHVRIEGEAERKCLYEKIEALRKEEEIDSFLRVIIRCYQDVDEDGRRLMNRCFAENSHFSWAAYFSHKEDSYESLFDDLLLLTIHDRVDTRDLMLALDAWYNKAKAKNVDVASILSPIIPLSNDADHYGFGSMRMLLERLYSRALEKKEK